MNNLLQTHSNTVKSDSRREFISKALAGLGLAVCSGSIASILESCEFYEKKNPVDSSGSIVEFNIASITELASLGIGIKRTFNDTKGTIVNEGYPVIVTRIGEKQFVALTGLCTHDGCYNEMYPPTELVDSIICTCHGSEFNYKDGSVIQGPAVKPLAVFRTSFDAAKDIIRIYFT